MYHSRTAMSVTIRDIAERMNLSKSTVSHALNGHSKHVSAEVRERVLTVAKEMGWWPNHVARALATGRTHTIGFVPHSLDRTALTSPFCRSALSAIYVAAEENHLHVLLPTGYDPADPEGTRGRLFEAQVDGLILLASTNARLLEDLIQRGLPMATVASPSVRIGASFNADNVGGASAAIDHLVVLGHRRIGLVTNGLMADVHARVCAARQRLALREAECCEYEAPELTVAGGYEAGLQLIDDPNRPTAVFCVNDQTAYGLIHAARDRGLRIPEDLSVVGFDDDELSHSFLPPLTTVRQPIAEMATAAFDSILSQIAGQPAAGRVFPTQLVLRASTARAPEGVSGSRREA